MSAYVAVTWTAGDIITEAKLDNMVSNDRAEDAHAPNGLILDNQTPSTPSATKVWLHAIADGADYVAAFRDDDGDVHKLGDFVRGTIALGTTSMSVADAMDEFLIPANMPAGKLYIDRVDAYVDLAPGASKTLAGHLNNNTTNIMTTNGDFSIAGASATSDTGNTVNANEDDLSAGDRLSLDITTATAGLSSTRLHVNVIVKNYLSVA